MHRHRLLTAAGMVAILVMAALPALLPVPVYAGTDTFYGDLDDAYIWNAGATYSTVLTATTGTVKSDHTDLLIGQLYDDEYHIYRSAIYYDTSGIPDAATITSATLKLYIDYDDSDTDFYIVVQNGQPTYPHKAATTGDYNEANYTGNGGQLSTAGITEETYEDLEFNATGLTWISLTGWTKLLLRSSRDINGDTPTGAELVGIYSHNYYVTYGSKAPVLEVTYTSPTIVSYPPTVSTGSYADVTNTTAKLYGDVTYVDNGLALYEGFEWGADPDPLSDSGGIPTWTISVAGTSKAEIDGTYHYAGTRSARFYRDGTNNPSAYFAHTAMAITEALSIQVRKDTNASFQLYHGNGAKLIDIECYNDEDIKYYSDTLHDTGANMPVGDWTELEIANANWVAGTYDLYQDGSLVCSCDMRTSSGWNGYVRILNGQGTSAFNVDNIGFRPYVAERGIQYGLTQTPTWSESEQGLFGTGSYMETVTGLSPETEYWYRAYVVNEEGTAYGSWSAFTTVSPPSITTEDASNLAATSARLNSALASDGADPCTIKFGWGLTSEAQVDDYDSTETLPGTYETGSYPYLDVEGLVSGYTYYFRVSATNDAGTTEGDELSFNTTASLLPPTNFVGYPEAEAISLSWMKGAGATNTLVRYGTTAFPGTTSTGTQAYYGTGSTYTVTGLTSGKTYYFSAWGESGGNYSASYTTFMMTTSASSGTTPGDIDVPTAPSRWFSAPDYTSMDGLGIIYDAFNAAADKGEIPKETAWFVLALFLSFIAGLGAYLLLGKKLMIGMITLTVCLAMGYFVRLIPWWIPLMSLILVIAWNQTHKQVAEG